MPDDNHISWESFQSARAAMAAEQLALAKQISEIDRRTSIHEAVCAERYNGLSKKINGVIVLCTMLLLSELFGTTPALQAGIKALGLSGIIGPSQLQSSVTTTQENDKTTEMYQYRSGHGQSNRSGQ